MLVYNVHGNVKAKLENEEFLRYIRRFDIIALMETHEERTDRKFGEMDIEWISEWEKAKRRENKGRASGGKMVAIKKRDEKAPGTKKKRWFSVCCGKGQKGEKADCASVFELWKLG